MRTRLNGLAMPELQHTTDKKRHNTERWQTGGSELGEFPQRNRTHLPDLNNDHNEQTQRKENTTDGKYTRMTWWRPQQINTAKKKTQRIENTDKDDSIAITMNGHGELDRNYEEKIWIVWSIKGALKAFVVIEPNKQF
jgi:hypothetical protein